MKTYNGIIKLVCLIVVAPLFIWMFALKDTFYLYGENHKAQKMNQSFSLSDVQDQVSPSSISSSEPLLSNGKLLHLFAHDLSDLEIEVVSYTPELIDSESQYKLYLGKLVLAGRYIELVRMVSIIEQSRIPIKIASLSFEYDRKKRKPDFSITMTMLLEQVEY